MTFDEELRDKVARMRALGVSELETSTGFVRRLTLGPKPEGSAPESAVVAAPVEVAPEVQAKADEAAKKAKIERLKFGAGK